MTDATRKPLALVTGVGPGTGAAVSRRFADGGYRVAMLARDANRLASLQEEIPDSIAVPCDVADPAALERAVARAARSARSRVSRRRRFSTTSTSTPWPCSGLQS